MSQQTEAGEYFKDSLQYIFGNEVLNVRDADAKSLLRLRINPNLFGIRSLSLYFEKFVLSSQQEKFDIGRFRQWLQQQIFETRDKGGHFYYFARTLVYSAVAEVLGIDYSPDFLRIPVASLAFTRKPPNITKQLYDTLSEKLESEIETLTILGAPVAIFILH